MIYLNHYKVACTEEKTLFPNLIFPQKCHFFSFTYAKKDTGLFYAPHKLAEMVLTPQIISYIRENPKTKQAFILAGGNQHFAGINPRKIKDTQLSYVYKFLPFTLTQVYAGRIAQQMGISDLVQTDASACASSLKVLWDVRMLMTHEGFDRVVVLGVEDAVSNSVLEFFGEAKAILTPEEEENGVLPSAFDSKNYGFHVGQGAVLAIFEDAPQENTIAALRHSSNASERSTNAIGQNAAGEGFLKAIQGCVAQGLDPEAVRVVKTHGTGTKSNNEAEKAALKGLNEHFVATSYKAKIGHTMGASGLLETVLLLENMRNGFVPEISNRTEDDHVFLSKPVEAPKGLVLSLAAGMGNIYSAAVFEPMGSA
jgi:3-oxoacyl-(acyl-carrier-protein) synthase